MYRCDRVYQRHYGYHCRPECYCLRGGLSEAPPPTFVRSWRGTLSRVALLFLLPHFSLSNLPPFGTAKLPPRTGPAVTRETASLPASVFLIRPPKLEFAITNRLIDSLPVSFRVGGGEGKANYPLAVRKQRAKKSCLNVGASETDNCLFSLVIQEVAAVCLGQQMVSMASSLINK